MEKRLLLWKWKTTLRVKHIKLFLEDIQKFSSRLSVYKGKTIYGAIAYLRAEEEANKYAERQGLFVIRATGDSASITNKKDPLFFLYSFI